MNPARSKLTIVQAVGSMATPGEKVGVDQDIEELLSDIEDKFKSYKLLLYNDDTHDMLEVLVQVIKACKVSPERAKMIMLEAHQTGSAVAKKGTKEECTKAQRILEEIDLATDIVEEIDN